MNNLLRDTGFTIWPANTLGTFVFRFKTFQSIACLCFPSNSYFRSWDIFTYILLITAFLLNNTKYTCHTQGCACLMQCACTAVRVDWDTSWYKSVERCESFIWNSDIYHTYPARNSNFSAFGIIVFRVKTKLQRISHLSHSDNYV